MRECPVLYRVLRSVAIRWSVRQSLDSPFFRCVVEIVVQELDHGFTLCESLMGIRFRPRPIDEALYQARQVSKMDRLNNLGAAKLSSLLREMFRCDGDRAQEFHPNAKTVKKERPKPPCKISEVFVRSVSRIHCVGIPYKFRHLCNS
jgi:hypothetical protein